MGELRRATYAVLLALLVAALAVRAGPSAAAAEDASAYCTPSATAFDPRDVPPEGSPPVSAPGLRQRSIVIRGLRTRLLRAGRATARTAVVFMHGSPGSGADWADLLTRLGTPHVQAIAIDMPGFGHAEPAWGASPKVGAAAAFLNSALRALRIRAVHLVAHDIGGPVGLEWASRHPRRLRSATLIDTGLLIGYRHHSLAQLSRTRIAGESFWLALNREAFRAGVQNGQRKPLPEEFVDRLYDDLDRETRCAIISLYRGSEEDEINAFARRQARVLAKRRGRPALVIWGSNDPYLPVAMAERQRRGFPQARIELFEGAGHWPFAEEPRRTRRLVVPFIRAAIDGDRERRRERQRGARG